jgi:hypothetical protein
MWLKSFGILAWVAEVEKTPCPAFKPIRSLPLAMSKTPPCGSSSLDVDSEMMIFHV